MVVRLMVLIVIITVISGCGRDSAGSDLVSSVAGTDCKSISFSQRQDGKNISVLVRV